MARRITLILLAALACVSLLLVSGGIVWTRARISRVHDEMGCQSALSGAAITQHVLEKAIANGILDLETVFAESYQRDRQGDVERLHTGYSRYLRHNLRPLQESFLEEFHIYSAHAVTADGYIPVHSDPDLDGIRWPALVLDAERPRPDPHVRRAGKTEQGHGVWQYDAPVYVFERLWGYFRVEIPEALIHLEIFRQGIVMSAALVAFSLLLAGLIFGVVRRTLRPLSGLVAATKEIGAGNFAVRCPPQGRDEIKVLAVSFNAMAEALMTWESRQSQLQEALEAARAELEQRVIERTASLEHANRELSQTLIYLQETQSELLQTQKLASVGQLAAGIAHEINTPIQFIADNLDFLNGGASDLLAALAAFRSHIEAQGASTAGGQGRALFEQVEKDLDLAFLRSEIPEAIDQALEGTRRIAEIVKAMKQFAHTDRGELTQTDLNECIRSTVTVARNEWKYVADLELDLDPDLPVLPCLPGELNQVILNLVVNAAHAIADVIDSQSGKKGRIRVSSRTLENLVEIAVADSGTGIPEEIGERIFDPFFTTKAVGRGSGQGLAIARNVIVEKLRGSLTFETEAGRGTTFFIRLPLAASGAPGASGEPDASGASGAAPSTVASPTASPSTSSHSEAA